MYVPASEQRRPIRGQKGNSTFGPSFRPSVHPNFLLFEPCQRMMIPNVNGFARARQPNSMTPIVDRMYFQRQSLANAPAGPPTPPLFTLCRNPTPTQLLWWDRITNVAQLNQDIHRATCTAASAIWGLQTVNAALSDVLPNLLSLHSNKPDQTEAPVTTTPVDAGRTSALTRTATKKPGRNRSPVLLECGWVDDYSEEITLQDLGVGDKIENYVEVAMSQKGSRYLQQQLLRGTPEQVNEIFDAIVCSADLLMTDMFGNFVIQSFFESGSTEHGARLMELIRGKVVTLAKQNYGCRVLQKILELRVDNASFIIVRELNGYVTGLIEHENANHVIQRCIEFCPSSLLETILNEIRPEVLRVSMHLYGCRIIQRILESCSDRQTKSILHDIYCYFDLLVQDQYGNYIIQHMLEHGNFAEKTTIARLMRGKVVQFSKHKYASNVIEKCMTYCSRAQRYYFLEEIIPENGCVNALRSMVEDEYGNYVIQTMLDVTDNRQRRMLINKMRPEMDTFRKLTYGRHIMAKVDVLTGRTKSRGSNPQC